MPPISLICSCDMYEIEGVRCAFDTPRHVISDTNTKLVNKLYIFKLKTIYLNTKQYAFDKSHPNKCSTVFVEIEVGSFFLSADGELKLVVTSHVSDRKKRANVLKFCLLQLNLLELN